MKSITEHKTAESINIQHKVLILIYIRFSLVQRLYAMLMLYYAFYVE